MVINDFDGIWSMFSPYETHTPLIVYADAPLSLPVAGEFFEPIAGRRTKKFQRLRCVQLRQLAFGHNQDGTETQRTLALEQCLRILAGERLDHGKQDITRNVIRQTYKASQP